MNPKFIMRAIEYARDGMYVPPELTKEMVKRIKAKKDKSFLVLFSYEMLPVLSELGYKDVTLALDKPRKSIYNVAKYYGYKVVDLKEIESMEFDVTLANPPFSKSKEESFKSKRKMNLYPYFFSWALKHSKAGAMIMPQTHNQIQKNHNRNIVDNCYEVTMIDDGVFKIATSVWCAFFDRKNKNRIDDFTVKTKMNDYVWVKGRISTSAKEWQSEEGYKTIHSVRKDGLVVLNKEEFVASSAVPNHGYAVVLGVTANKTYIIQCESQMVGGNVYFVWFKTKKEAEDFQRKLDEKLKVVDHLRGNMGVMNIHTLEQIDFN